PATGSIIPPSNAPDAPRPPEHPTLASEAVPVKPMTFDQAVRAALKKNPTALDAIEEVRRYHALMEQVRAGALPTLNGIGTYTRLDGDRVSPGTPGDPKAIPPIPPTAPIVFAPKGSL